jgi:hypothetical protein
MLLAHAAAVVWVRELKKRGVSLYSMRRGSRVVGNV